MKTSEVFNFNNLLTIDYHIWGDCNFACQMCSYEYFRTLGDHSPELYENTLNQILE